MSADITTDTGRVTNQALKDRIDELEEKFSQTFDVIKVMTWWVRENADDGLFPVDLQAHLDYRRHLNWCGPCMGKCQNLDKYCRKHDLRWSKCGECRCDENDVYTTESIKQLWEMGVCLFCRKRPCLFHKALCRKHNQPLKDCWECHLASENCHNDSATPNDVFAIQEAAATKRRIDVDVDAAAKQTHNVHP